MSGLLGLGRHHHYRDGVLHIEDRFPADFAFNGRTLAFVPVVSSATPKLCELHGAGVPLPAAERDADSWTTGHRARALRISRAWPASSTGMLRSGSRMGSSFSMR